MRNFYIWGLFLFVVSVEGIKIASDDGLEMVFDDHDGVRISGLGIDGKTVSGGSSQGGFSALFHGEDDAEFTGPNILVNPSFAGGIDGWASGCNYDDSQHHSAPGSVKVQKSDKHLCLQHYEFKNSTPKVLKISGWSKAEGVTGSADTGYSIGVDFEYEDGTFDYGIYVEFATGTHDWEERSVLFTPKKQLKSFKLYLLFRFSHEGVVWFDDISVASFTRPTLSNGTLEKVSDSLVKQRSFDMDSLLDVS